MDSLSLPGLTQSRQAESWFPRPVFGTVMGALAFLWAAAASVIENHFQARWGCLRDSSHLNDGLSRSLKGALKERPFRNTSDKPIRTAFGPAFASLMRPHCDARAWPGLPQILARDGVLSTAQLALCQQSAGEGAVPDFVTLVLWFDRGRERCAVSKGGGRKLCILCTCGDGRRDDRLSSLLSQDSALRAHGGSSSVFSEGWGFFSKNS